jgi:ABC-type branched-subunit amino acid transport system substrate-binding protein
MRVLLFIGILLFVANVSSVSGVETENKLPAFLLRTTENLQRAYKASNILNKLTNLQTAEEIEIPEFIIEKDTRDTKEDYIYKAKRSYVGPDTGDLIVLGTTTALTGDQLPYSTEQFSYFVFTVNYINNVLGGIEVNGTLYKVKLVWYDDASNCELTAILAQRLVLVDEVDVLLVGTTVGCNGTSVASEQYGVPSINTANYAYFFEFPDGLNWTVVPIINPAFIAAPCIQQFCAAGAKSAVVAGVPTIYPAFNYSLLVSVGTYCKNFSLLYFDQLDYESVIGTNYKNYLQPFIEKWKNADADLFLGGVGPDQAAQNLFSAMRYNRYNPSGYYGWDDITDDQTRQLVGWQGYGATAATDFDPSFNFTDPVFTNVSNFAAAYFAVFNATANAYASGNAQAVILAVTAIKNAGSFEPSAIRNALFNFNQTTIQGKTYFNTLTGYGIGQYECFQFKSAQQYVAIGNPSLNDFTLSYPWEFEYIPGYKFAPKPRTWWQKNRTTLLTCVIVIPVVLLIIAVAVAYFLKKYHVLFIEDKKLDKTDW